MLLLLLALACSDDEPAATATHAALSTADAPKQPFTWVELEPRQGTLAAQLATHCQAAAASGRDPFVELTAIWCAPCQALRKHLDDPLMVDAFTGTYVISVDVDLFGEQLSPNGLTAYGVPTIFALGPDCSPTGATITGGAWEEDIPANMAPALKAFFRGQPG